MSRKNIPDASDLRPVRWAFDHFRAMDSANAAIHCAQPRWSPITFRLAEFLTEWSPDGHGESADVRTVMLDKDTYPEDPGR